MCMARASDLSCLSLSHASTELDDVMNKQETDVELTDSMPRAARVQRCRVVAAP